MPTTYFREWEAKYGIEVQDENPLQYFGNIIRAAHKKTGRQVVIPVDEYDKPLLGTLKTHCIEACISLK